MDMFLFLLSSLVLNGVFGDEVKSVMEGHSVTLNTDIEIQRDDKIMWYYGLENTFVARITKKDESTMLSDDERYKDRLKLNDQTGSLTINNLTTDHSRLYTLKISSNNKVSYKTFNVTVYARLPVPVISRDCTQCYPSSSSSKCSVLCSVMNVTHVSLSWYNGSRVHSSISVSDLNIRPCPSKSTISLPLEVEYQDTNTYRCVINNPITNHTQQLNITHVCQPCTSSTSGSPVMKVIITTAVFALLICVTFLIIVIHKRKGLRGKLCANTLKHLNTADFSDQSDDEEIFSERLNPNSKTEDIEASGFLNGSCN